MRHILQVTGSCHALLVMAASASLIARAAIQPLTPRIPPAFMRAPARGAP